MNTVERLKEKNKQLQERNKRLEQRLKETIRDMRKLEAALQRLSEKTYDALWEAQRSV